MKKSVKKIAAIAMAAVVMVTGTNSISANAASESVSWSATDVNVSGAPTSETKVGYAVLEATSETYTGKVTSMSNITNRSLTISSTTHSMKTGSIVYNNTGKRTWKIGGGIRKVEYKMVAKTSLKTSLYVEGTISR